jgi:hypothetical protein
MCPLKESGNHSRRSFPVLDLSVELLGARPSERVDFHLALGIGYTPSRPHPTLLLKAKQSRIDGTLIQAEEILGHLLDASSDAVTVKRPDRFEGLQNQEIERTIGDFGFRFRHVVLQQV